MLWLKTWYKQLNVSFSNWIGVHRLLGSFQESTTSYFRPPPTWAEVLVPVVLSVFFEVVDLNNMIFDLNTSSLIFWIIGEYVYQNMFIRMWSKLILLSLLWNLNKKSLLFVLRTGFYNEFTLIGTQYSTTIRRTLTRLSAMPYPAWMSIFDIFLWYFFSICIYECLPWRNMCFHSKTYTPLASKFKWNRFRQFYSQLLPMRLLVLTIYQYRPFLLYIMRGVPSARYSLPASLSK